MKLAELTVKTNIKLRTRPKVATTYPRPTSPNQCWGIDLPSHQRGLRWVYLVVELD